MIIGHNFTEQVFTAKALAEFINIFLNKKDGIVRGLDIVTLGKTLTVKPGLAIVQGRMIEVFGDERIQVAKPNGTYKLIIDIDLTQTNTSTALNQVHLSVVNGDLVKENIFENGKKYQFELAKFTLDGTGIKNIEKTKEVIEYNEIIKLFSSKIKALESTSSVVTRSEITNYITKEEFNQKKNIVKSGTTIPNASDLEEGEIYIQYF